ncbi:MAG TPA: FAD-dependent monooxygenase [Anaerolineales bacterium]|nr:FAD-dependent monooxygenase [Anaerolineales bacterium]
MSKQKGENAVVIGASMAGLLTARVLTDHFDQVTMIERDLFPSRGANRKGVPQGKHTHVLLERGRRIMESHLPGLTDELMEMGAANIEDVSRDVRWFQGGAYYKPGVSGISGVGVSRPTLEGSVRDRVLALPNIQAFENCNVLGLLTTDDKSRVTGIRFKDRSADNTEKTITADLVVDAGGRGSHSPVWLEELGYERPLEEEVKVGVGYTTCYYRRKPDHLSGLKGISFLTTPPNKRLGVMLAQDGNRWVVTLGGYLGDHTSTKYPEFLESARRLPSPEIYNVIKNAEPLGEPVAYKLPANLRHHYDGLSRFPEGYLVIGDALYSFNPIYGQGMTVAALESVALNECLKNGKNQLAKHFFARASKIIDDSWNTAVGNDLAYPKVEGQRTIMMRFLNWYMGRLQVAAHMDANVFIAFLKVINMVAPAPTLMKPNIVWRVLKANLGPGSREANTNEEQNLWQSEKATMDQ